VIEKNLKAVPNIVDVASFGGPTREYQVRVDPEKLISYGLSIGQVEQQLTSNNANSGGSFVEAGLQQINIQEVGLVKNVQDIANTVITAKNGTPIRVKDIAVISQGPKIRLGQFSKAIRREDGKVIDNEDVVSGIALLRKGADADLALQGIHQKVKELNETILPAGVKVVPLIDRSDLVKFTTDTVLHNLRDGIILVVIILFLFLGNIRGAIIVALTIPFALLFAAFLSKSEGDSREPAVAGRAGFRHGRPMGPWLWSRTSSAIWAGATGMAKRPSSRSSNLRHEVQRPVFYAIAIIITAYLPIFTLQRVEGRLFKPMAWTVAFALLGAIIFSIVIVPALSSIFYPRGTKEWHNPVMVWLTARYRRALRVAIRMRVLTVAGGLASLALVLYLWFGE